MRTPIAAVVTIVLVLSACAQPEPTTDARNVVLITVDALRADSVSWAGASFDTTPNLAALAADAVVFDQALTSFPGTTASMPSLMTGLFPSFEGVGEWNSFTYHGFNEFETAEEAERPALSGNLRMLAEILAERGMTTVGFNTNPNLTAPRNFNQGFMEYEDFAAYMKSARESRRHPLEAAYPPADVVMAKAVPALRAVAGEPFFMWIHLMEPHSPYLPPDDHARVSPRTFTGLGDLEINGALYHFLQRQWGASPEKITHPSLDELGISRAALTEHLLGLYEGEIHFCDAELGRFVETMRELGLLNDTLFILTADHGEEFFDHGYVTHHFKSGLAEELIRIPLLIRPPGGLPGGRRVEQLVRMVDIAPTVLDFVGHRAAAAQMEGATLRPLMDGRSEEPRTAFFSTIPYQIVRTERWKYRLERPSDPSGETTQRLFDIVADPMETDDLAARHPEIVAELRTRYEEFARSLADRTASPGDGEPGPTAPHQIDEETRRQLEALGYVE
ncbi:MAG TPA: sulfatase-like hydrolase/transferase [Methylomirabilota bacterium]|nr:sulfatase-like hydrolase/transferase [Methylomirabilota bacterium]